MCNEPKRICFKTYLVSLIIIILQGWWQQVGGRAGGGQATSHQLAACLCAKILKSRAFYSNIFTLLYCLSLSMHKYTVIQPAYWSTKYQVIYFAKIYFGWQAVLLPTQQNLAGHSTTKPKPTKYDDTTTLYFALLQELEREYTICIYNTYISRYLGTYK